MGQAEMVPALLVSLPPSQGVWVSGFGRTEMVPALLVSLTPPMHGCTWAADALSASFLDTPAFFQDPLLTDSFLLGHTLVTGSFLPGHTCSLSASFLDTPASFLDTPASFIAVAVHRGVAPLWKGKGGGLRVWVRGLRYERPGRPWPGGWWWSRRPPKSPCPSPPCTPPQHPTKRITSL
jgi:hypothetical protein